MRLFISYRRSDSQSMVRLIHDRLCVEFGTQNVFLDIDAIPLASDFIIRIKEALAGCDVVLAVMGRGWPVDRLLEEDDPVRMELETAIRSGIPIVPILVDGATMPKPEQLPRCLEPLSRSNGISLDAGRNFRDSLEGLIRYLPALVRRFAPNREWFRFRRVSRHHLRTSASRRIASVLLIATCIAFVLMLATRLSKTGSSLGTMEAVAGGVVFIVSLALGRYLGRRRGCVSRKEEENAPP